MTKLLLLEDNEADASLALHHMPDDVDPTVVCSRQSYEDALEQSTWDLIIADINIPGYSGLDALLKAKARWPDIPVLIFSGSMSDPEILPLEDAGASDVLLKDRPTRLPWAIRRALRDRKREAELVRRQTEALRSQRVQIIGEMAAGFVHDLRNMLTIITGALFLFEGTVPQDKCSFINRAQRSVEKILQMVDRLMVFVSGSNGHAEFVQVRPIIQEWMQFLPGMFPTLDFETHITTTAVMAVDPTFLRQVITNFVSNARDAGACHVQFIATDVALEDYRPAIPTDANCAGRFLAVRVQDDAGGVPPEIMPKIFEPFFTTKPPEKGTGLGLSTVRNIVELYSGFVDVQSEAGQGSTFSAFLRLPEESKSP